MKIIGITKKQGTYNGVAYENYDVTFLAPIPKGAESHGTYAKTFKSSKQFIEIACKQLNCSFDKLIGHNAQVTFNQYGQPNGIVIDE